MNDSAAAVESPSDAPAPLVLPLDQIAQSITVRHLMTPIARSVSVGASSSSSAAYRLLTQHHFDQAPVVDPAGTVVGLVTTASLRGARKVRVRPLASSLLIDQAAPVATALARLGKEPMLFVIGEAGLVGFVTPSDLNKQPVRVHFYLLIADLEMTMAAAARRRLDHPDEALQHLSPTRRPNLIDRHEAAKALNVEADVLTAFEFPDLIRLMAKTGLHARFGYTSSTSWNAGTERLKAFRDFVMHPTSELLGTWSIDRLIDLDSALRRMLGESELGQPDQEGYDAPSPAGYTQRVTANDIRDGQVRVPHDAKALFPPTRSRIVVDFLGHTRESRWDPRYGPGHERSGVVGIGRELMRLARQDEILFLDRRDDGTILVFR